MIEIIEPTNVFIGEMLKDSDRDHTQFFTLTRICKEFIPLEAMLAGILPVNSVKDVMS